MKYTLHKKIRLINILFLFIIFLQLDLHAQPGAIDPTFGNNGIFVGRNYGNCYGAAMQDDGKIIMIGEGFSDTYTGFGVVRLTVDGSPDESFGTVGKVVTDFGFEVQVAFAVTVQTDGKIVVAGVNYEDDNTRNNFLVARYLTDGRIDSSFAEKGWLTTDFNGDDYARAIQVLPDGKILVAGSNTYRALIARYNTDGSLDNSFGNAGLVITKIYNFPVINAMAIQEDGKIVLAGTVSQNQNGSVALCRYMADGTPDNGFGTKGVLISDWVSGYGEICNAIKIQDDGKIILAGIVVTNGPFEQTQAIVRYTIDGNLDNNFGEHGISLFNPFANALKTYSITLQEDGTIISTGHLFQYPDLNAVYLTRINSNGIVDNNFGNNGIVKTEIEGGALAYKVFTNHNNQILIIGKSSNSSLSETNFLAVRYNGDEGSLPITYKNFTASQKNGFIQLNWQTTNEINNNYFAIERSSSGNQFIEITRIRSITNNAANDYSYTDKLPAEGSNKYRIKQVDKDGKSSYSKTISIVFTKNGNIKLQPNPAKDKLIISGLQADENNNIAVTDMQGRKLLQLNCRTAQRTVNIQALPNSHYLLTVQNKAGNFTLKFIKN